MKRVWTRKLFEIELFGWQSKKQSKDLNILIEALVILSKLSFIKKHIRVKTRTWCDQCGDYH